MTVVPTQSDHVQLKMQECPYRYKVSQAPVQTAVSVWEWSTRPVLLCHCFETFSFLCMIEFEPLVC